MRPTPLVVHDHGDPDAFPLVLLHGLTDAGPSWRDAIDRWSPHYRVLAVDQLGHGASPRFTEAQLVGDPMEHAYEAITSTIERLLEALPGRRPIVVGHSMGGGMAAALGARRPDLVTGLVLEDPAWGGDDRWEDAEELTRQRLEECRRAAADLDAEIARGRSQSPDWPAEELRPWAEASAAFDLTFGATGLAALAVPWQQVAAAVTVPTLVVTGTEEVILDDELLAAVAALANPRLEVAVVDGAGHCVRRDRTESFHSVVDPWLAELAELDQSRSLT